MSWNSFLSQQPGIVKQLRQKKRKIAKGYCRNISAAFLELLNLNFKPCWINENSYMKCHEEQHQKEV